MRKILVVGIGAGNPEHMTVQAINALNAAEALFVPRKGDDKADLAELRRDIIARFVSDHAARTIEFDLPVRDAANPSYTGGVEDWYEVIAVIYARLFTDTLGESGVGALLVWGDPSLYDGTLRILARVQAMGVPFEIEVIPGISSVHALTAAHATTLNRIGQPVTITSGRRLSENAPDGDVVVMLDSRLAFNSVDGEAYDIYWGAYVGTKDEILISGRLGEVAPEIEKVRAEARARHGWIMDLYLLRKRADPSA
ncbi:MAG: precorrin-6A synthase (deacetylating) [Devosia sp.]